jgi:hypothetical protein
MEFAAAAGQGLTLARRPSSGLGTALAVHCGAKLRPRSGQNDWRLAPTGDTDPPTFEDLAEPAGCDPVDPPDALLMIDDGVTIESREDSKLCLRDASQLAEVAQIVGAVEAAQPRRWAFDASQLNSPASEVTPERGDESRPRLDTATTILRYRSITSVIG